MPSNDFALDAETIYLNHAAVAPWPQVTVTAVSQFARENGAIGATHYPEWLKTETRLRQRLASLINANSPDDIALLKSTSEGLSITAQGIDWVAGDNIVSILQEFPSNRIVWESLKPRGVEVRLLDLSSTDDPETDLIALCDHNTRLISVSSVQYAGGRRMDLQKIGRYCRHEDIIFVVDAIQSLGALPFDIREIDADVVVADGHKWMLGPEGLALFYCSQAMRERLQLHQFGWHMVENAGDFDRYDWTPAKSARRFECGSPNMLGIHALNASLGLLLDIGIEQIHRRIEENCDLIIEKIKQRGFRLLTPENQQQRAGIVTFHIDGEDNDKLQRQLMQNQVICANRGGGIRFSPHFYNSAKEIAGAFEMIDSLLGQA